MIHSQFLLILILLSIEALVLYFSEHKRFKFFFKFIPAVFWIYFLPMLAATFGLIDSKSRIYQGISTNLLPASLFLLLLSSDIKSIIKLGKPALIMMFAGSLGIMLGAPLVFFLFRDWVGAQFWSGFGALSASWTGGSANMIAVKEAIGTPDSVFLPMVIVDTIVPYAWMGILIAFAGLQPLFDRWCKSDRRVLDKLTCKASAVSSNKNQKLRINTTILILAAAVLGTIFSRFLAGLLPQIKDIISAYAWTIIIVSVLGVLFSFTPARKMEGFGASRIGYFILYFVLTSIGAKASIADIGSTVILILAGFLLVFFHAMTLFLTARIIRAPMFLAAVASQANIGGVASAPIVATIYQPGLASVGLLLAILGNILGTYLGIITGQLCLFMSRI